MLRFFCQPHYLTGALATIPARDTDAITSTDGDISDPGC